MVPKISVITPTYNQAHFIEQTIESILGQDYPDLEYIVIDGGSTDGTVDILKKYGSRIIWRSEKDNGLSDAINKGLRMATGEVVAYLNSDDLYGPHTLKMIGALFQERPEVMWACGKCRIINDRGQEFLRGITAFKDFWLLRYAYPVLLAVNFISQPAVFLRREAVQETGYFNEDLKFAMDYEYWVRLGRKYKPAVINEYLADFRVHARAKGSQGYKRQFREELAIARQYSQGWFPVLVHHAVCWGIIFCYLFLK